MIYFRMISIKEQLDFAFVQIMHNPIFAYITMTLHRLLQFC